VGSCKDEYDEEADDDEIDENETTLNIHLENKPWHTKVGREYRGALKVSEKFRAIVRFCPDGQYADEVDEDTLKADKEGKNQITMADWEEGCKLKERIWAGPEKKVWG